MAEAADGVAVSLAGVWQAPGQLERAILHVIASGRRSLVLVMRRAGSLLLAAALLTARPGWCGWPWLLAWPWGLAVAGWWGAMLNVECWPMCSSCYQRARLIDRIQSVAGFSMSGDVESTPVTQAKPSVDEQAPAGLNAPRRLEDAPALRMGDGGVVASR